MTTADSVRATTVSALDVSDGELPATLVVEPVDFEHGSRSPDELQRLVARLRAPGGCPWDREQTNESLSRNLIEETYELLDAIEQRDPTAIQEELGDYLLQAYMHAQIAEEHGHFVFEDVVGSLIGKLVRRHPHVFGSSRADDPDAVVETWDEIKRGERRSRGELPSADPLGRVPSHLPALMRAQTLIRRASRAGTGIKAGDYHLRSTTGSAEDRDVNQQFITRLLSVVEDANREQVDLEGVLRAWTLEFETRVASQNAPSDTT